jgi:hypothetical protein
MGNTLMDIKIAYELACNLNGVYGQLNAHVKMDMCDVLDCEPYELDAMLTDDVINDIV